MIKIDDLNIGDTVCYRVVGNIWKGVILSKKKHLKIETMMGGTKSLKIEDVILPDEEICVIYQRFKRVESYRVEREKYPHLRIPAKNLVSTSTSIQYDEFEYGVLSNEIYPYHYYASYINGNVREMLGIPSHIQQYFEKYEEIIKADKLSVIILFDDKSIITFDISINGYGGISINHESKKHINYSSLL